MNIVEYKFSHELTQLELNMPSNKTQSNEEIQKNAQLLYEIYFGDNKPGPQNKGFQHALNNQPSSAERMLLALEILNLVKSNHSSQYENQESKREQLLQLNKMKNRDIYINQEPERNAHDSKTVEKSASKTQPSTFLGLIPGLIMLSRKAEPTVKCRAEAKEPSKGAASSGKGITPMSFLIPGW